MFDKVANIRNIEYPTTIVSLASKIQPQLSCKQYLYPVAVCLGQSSTVYKHF